MSEESNAVNSVSFEEVSDGLDIRKYLPHQLPSTAKAKQLYAKIVGFITENPGVHNPKLIAQMKAAAMKRPDWIPAEAWNHNQTPGGGERRMDPHHAVFCYMAAWGLSPQQMAKNLGIVPQTANQLLKDPDILAEIKKIQFKIWGSDPTKYIKSILPDAIMTAHKIMIDDTVKAQTRLNASQDFMDRALGKAPQTLEVHAGGMRDVLETLARLEKRTQAQANTPGSEAEEEIEAEFTDVTPGEILDPKPLIEDEIDRVVREMYE